MTSREEYVAGLKRQLDGWNADVSRWEAQADKLQGDVKAQGVRRLEVLRLQREFVRYKLGVLENAPAAATWSDLTQRADEAWAKMRAAIDEARSHFEKA